MTDILGIGSSGLTAYRKLLETVGSNITNANTDGYVRRDVALTTSGESTMLPTAKLSSVGSGVIVDTVRRAKDYFLQSQALAANSTQQQQQVLADSLGQLEKTILSSGNDPGATVQELFNRFSEVANAPTSVPARLAVVEAGNSVARMFNQAASAINYSMNSLRTAIDVSLQSINALTSQLATLNSDIQRSSAGGQTPNDMLDQRDKLLTKLSDLTSFNFQETAAGTITLYLGDSTSGKPLIDAQGAHTLGAQENGDRLDIVFDPYTTPMVTSQLKSGLVAGLLDFRKEAQGLMMDMDRLAVGLTSAINDAHEQGVDLNGRPGKPLFSPDSLASTAGTANRGAATLTLSISEAAQLTNATYDAKFDSATGNWTVKSSQGRAVTGKNDLVLDGVTFKFDGTAADGDTFSASPLRNAAASIRFLRQEPAELALALPYYIDPASTNKGNETITLQTNTTPAAASSLLSASAVFGSSNAPVDFRRDGAAFAIPAGSVGTQLTSLGTLSAIHFPTNEPIVTASSANRGTAQMQFALADPTQTLKNSYSATFNGISGSWTVRSSSGTTTTGTGNISIDGVTLSFSGAAQEGDRFTLAPVPGTLAEHLRAIDNAGPSVANSGLHLKFTATSSSSATDIDLLVRPKGSTLNDIADAINEALAQQGQATIAAASVANGMLSVTALGDYSVSNGQFTGIDAKGQAASISGQTQDKSDATSLRLFTREGRQLSGPPMLADEAAAFLTEANGFLPGATYQPPSSNIGYPGIDLQSTNNIVRVTQNGTSSAIVNLAAYGNLDAAHQSMDGATSGAVYALDVNGLSPIRLTGDKIAGLSANEIADTLANSLNAQATTYSWSGTSFNLAASPVRNFNFDVSLNGKTYSVSFNRTQSSDGKWLNSGTFDLHGASGFTVSLVDDAPGANGQATQRVVLTADKSLSTNAPTLSITPSGNTKLLGLSDANGASSLTAKISASADLLSSVLAHNPQQITINGSQSLTINATSGLSNGIAWSLVNGKLKLQSDQPITSITPTDAVNALGLSQFDPVTGTGSGDLLTSMLSQVPTNQQISDALSANPKVIQVSLNDGNPPVDVTIDALSGTQAGSSISWSFVNGKLQLSSTDPNTQIASVTRDEAALDLGVADNTITNGVLTGSAIAYRLSLANLTVTTPDGKSHAIDINATTGADTASGVTWSVENGRLVLTSQNNSLNFVATSVQQRDKAASAGFMGTDLDLTAADVTRITAGGDFLQTLLAARKPQLTFNTSSGMRQLTISSVSGSDSVSGIAWSLVNGRLRFSSNDPALFIVPSDAATALGVGNTPNSSGIITGTSDLLPSLLSSAPVALRVNGPNGDMTININSLNGSANGVDWTLMEGRLSLSSRFAGLTILDATPEQTAITRSAGFIGSGRDAAITSRELHLTSSIAANDGTLVDGSASVSNVGETLSLNNQMREGLIVALASSSANGLRRLVGAVPATNPEQAQATPNVRVRILAPNKLEILDPVTGISLAQRSFKEGEPVNYLGLQFTIRGSSVAGDEFAINFDTGRTGDNRNALSLARMSGSSIFAARNGTFQDVYNSVTAKLGATVQVATNKAEAAKKSSSDLKSAYDSKVGVDLDKEAADLLRYQQAYQAAAQVVMAARDMFSTILKVF